MFPRFSLAVFNSDSASAKLSTDVSASLLIILNAAIPEASVVIPVIIKPIGLADIAAFHAYCAAVASVISPVNAPTAICFSVIVPSDAACARLSALTAAV